MGSKLDNKPNPEIARYWNDDGSYVPNATNTNYGSATSSIDASGALTAAAGGTPPPPDAPDVTDQLIRQKQASEMTRLMLGVGRRSSFSQGGMGDLNLGTKQLTPGGS